MATSEATTRAVFVVAAVAFPLALSIAACGQVTGLADDYTFDLEAGAQRADGGGTPTTSDGAVEPATEAGAKCTGGDRSRAATSITDSNGANLSLQCRSCLAENCCSGINSCANNGDCAQSMQCVFNCQKGGNKRDCLKGCDPSFMQALGTCVQSFCASPVCQLQ